MQGESDHDTEPLTPDVLLERRREHRETSDTDDSDLVQLLTPDSRFRVLDALLGVNGEPQTESQVAEQADVSQASANRHLKGLVDDDLVHLADKVGNARRYRANTDHPLVQVLAMGDRILRFGQSPQLLDDQWVGEPQYEPGDHPADPRDE